MTVKGCKLHPRLDYRGSKFFDLPVLLHSKTISEMNPNKEMKDGEKLKKDEKYTIGTSLMENGAPTIKTCISGVSGKFNIDHEIVHMWQTFSLGTMENNESFDGSRDLRRLFRNAANGLSILFKPKLAAESKISWRHFNYQSDPWELDVLAAFIKRFFCVNNGERIMTIGQAKAATDWFVGARESYKGYIDDYVARIYMVKFFRKDLMNELYRRVLRIV